MDLLDNFTPYLKLNIPIWYLLTLFVGLSIAISLPFIKRYSHNRTKRIVTGSVLITYLLLLLGSTVFFRTVLEDCQIEWMPFWKYSLILSDKSKLYLFWEIVLNIGIYIPIGFLICAYSNHRNVCRLLLCGCGISITNELLQYITKTGLCETDDVVNNCMGCLLGVALFYLLRFIVILIKD